MGGKRTTMTCVRCGKPFRQNSGQQIYCSAACREASRVRGPTRKEQQAIERGKAQTAAAHEKISRIAREAREHGLSYGRYMAMMEQQSIKPDKEECV